MANMSYCRFENTLLDLKDAERHMQDKGLSASERQARIDLIALCVEIAHVWGDEVGVDVELFEDDEEDMDEAAHLN